MSKIRTTIIVIILLLAAALKVSAFEIQFEGAPPHIAKLITGRLKSESNPSFALLDSLTNALVNSAYLDATIKIKDGKLIVSSGRRYVLSNVIFIEDSTFEIQVNRPFDSANTALVVELRLQSYRENGFLYAVGQTSSINLKDTSVELSVAINKGPQVKYGEPRFAGLTRTNSKTIERYLPENPDGLLTAAFIEEVSRSAGQISFVKFAPPVSLQPRPGYTVSDLVLNFIEKTPVRFDGAAGISGGENNDLIWSFNLTLNNLFGQGRKALIKSERPDSKRSSLNVGYSQPLFLMGLGELNLNVRTRDYRDEFYEFAIDAGYETRINRDFVTGFKFEWKSSKPEFGNVGYNRYTGQFSIARKSFSSDFNPRSGLSLKWGIDFSFRRYTAESLPRSIQSRTFNETRNSLRVDLYQPIVGPMQFHSSLNYIGLETGEDFPPLSELILIGGPGTIRGYRNEQFSAVRTAFGTFEPRMRFRQGFIFAFYDAAYLNNRVLDANSAIATNEQFKWSYGLGFGLGDGNRSVVLSLGINPEQGLGEPRLSIELSSDI